MNVHNCQQEPTMMCTEATLSLSYTVFKKIWVYPETGALPPPGIYAKTLDFEKLHYCMLNITNVSSSL